MPAPQLMTQPCSCAIDVKPVYENFSAWKGLVAGCDRCRYRSLSPVTGFRMARWLRYAYGYSTTVPFWYVVGYSAIMLFRCPCRYSACGII